MTPQVLVHPALERRRERSNQDALAGIYAAAQRESQEGMKPVLRIRARRLYLRGWRLHHGALGVGLAVLGALLAYHDRRDAGAWFRAERLQ